MNTKKSLFRVLLITLCFIALGMFFQTGKSASLYSAEPLPTIEATLRPGVDWVTVRNLSVEASTIWQENGQVFAISRPIIDNARDAAFYQELLEDRLNSIANDQVLTAEITFKIALSLTEVESLLGQTTIISLLASGDGGSTGQVAYPPEDVPAEFQEEFNQVFEALNGGTPAPSLSPNNYIAASVSANTFLLRALTHAGRIFTVDVGPIDLIEDFPDGNFSTLKDVSYDYELHIGSVCEFTLLRNRIDDLSTNGEVPAVVSAELKDVLTNSEISFNANDITSARSEMALFFETLIENITTIDEGALKEIGIIGDCLVARNMQTSPLVNAGDDQTIDFGESVTVNAVYSDSSEAHSARIDWGDGIIEDMPVNITGPGVGEVTGEHMYTNPGNYAVEVCITDLYGGVGCDTTSVAAFHYFNFTGFFPPVDNQPILNTVKAGSAIPIKFSLNGYQGLDIFFVGYPASAVVTCGSSVEDAIEQTVTAGGSSLSYDAITDQYTYVWKTDKTWANACRTFVLRLSDGSYYRANFKFK